MMLDVMARNKDFLFRGIVIKFDKEYLKLCNMVRCDIPVMQKGVNIKVVGMAYDGTIVACQGNVCESTKESLTITDITHWSDWDRREFYRQKTDISTHLKVLSSDFNNKKNFGERFLPVKCKVLDVSGGGAKIICEEEFSVGDRILLEQLAIDSESSPLLLLCEIKRRSAGKYGHVYGVQFLEVDKQTQDNIIQAIFRIQRKETKGRRI